ncbi:TIMELESS-interacting protein isoform X2 [Dunckerocampus dactyliophorus]|uniref:TIMELESS-interacting protein isoform X2 n=1 Tax=Dunckerocampus dactyliophorus TaxID=161453 RepID=UPI0024074D21|nr:TIMELESS-interacting protein isoform X2 [Dunckerocampus dactyliophorus]
MVKTAKYANLENETFSPLPPPLSPGQAGDPFGNDESVGEVSKLAEVPAAKRKGVKRPQPKLDSHRLTSDKGLPALRTLFDNVRFKGKGHEAEDVRLLMQKMENWAHRLYPKLQFEDFIDRVEKLGTKKEVQTCLKRIRLDMPLTHEDFIGEEEAPPESDIFGEADQFTSQSFPSDPQGPIHSTPAPAGPVAPSLTDEERQLMELNRQRALERRLARQQHLTDSQTVGSSLQAGDSSEDTSEPFVNESKGQDEDEKPATTSSRSSSPGLSVKSLESSTLCEKVVPEPTPASSNGCENEDEC